MKLFFDCRECRGKLTADSGRSGQAAICPDCGTSNVIPVVPQQDRPKEKLPPLPTRAQPAAKEEQTVTLQVERGSNFEKGVGLGCGFAFALIVLVPLVILGCIFAFAAVAGLLANMDRKPQQHIMTAKQK